MTGFGAGSDWVQFLTVGMAAFCISFGVIYSLIFCLKSRRKEGNPEERMRLRDEPQPGALERRKSTSLTSPPSISGGAVDSSVINPHYNASPYKVPTRHLRSTSATYSPTHYLSPHHRRNSTPTQAPLSTSTCSCCGCPTGPKSRPGEITEDHEPTNADDAANTGCKCEENGNFLSTHKCRTIPVQNMAKKSFSFGPIPKARKARARERELELGEVKGVKVPSPVPSFQEAKVNGNVNMNLNIKEEEKGEKEKAEKGCEEARESFCKSPNNNQQKAGKSSGSDLFRKENMVLEEIPYYLENPLGPQRVH